jgi:tRNA pseudouridine55 synthase
VLDGFLVLDKPTGCSSHDLVALARRLTGQRKIGHTGTLDPFATGVLPLALGEATKAIPFLDESEKVYQATLRLGASTDTQDLTGTVVRESDWRRVTPDMVRALVPRFTGDLVQTPPMYSALKRDGVPLYRLARRGETVEREGRPIRVFSLTIQRLELPDIDIIVRCSRGTYVRTLASDMGDDLGCGAHLTSLRRLASGPFVESAALAPAALGTLAGEGQLHRALVSIDTALAHLRCMSITGDECRSIGNGIPPRPGRDGSEPFSAGPGELFRLVCSDAVVAVGEWRDPGGLRLARVFNQLCPLHSRG